MGTIGRSVDGILGVSPEAAAIEFKGRWVSWGALRSAMTSLRALLEGAGLGAETRIAVMLRNRPENVSAMLEVLGGDRCLVTLNPLHPDAKLAADLERVAAPAVVASAEDWARPGIEAAARATGALGVESGADAAGAPEFRLRFAADPSRWTRRAAEGIAIEMLTSGTTGTPKRIPLARKNFERTIADWGSFEKGRGEGDAPRLRSGVQIWHTPFSHIAGVGGLVNVVLAGRKFCLIERFNLEEYVDAIRRHQPKVLNGPPTILRMMLDRDLPQDTFKSVAVYRSGTAPLDPALADAFSARFGIPVLQNYGATEYAGGVAGWTIEDHKTFAKSKRGSVGRVNKGIEARAVDPDTGAPLPAGEKGLLEVRAPYLGNGVDWMRTTDIAIVDAENFLFVLGRADAAIIRGGYKVIPDDVVAALESHPAVREASVVGIPDARLGQVPVAALRLRAGAAAPSPEAITEFLREKLLPYQVPVQFRIVDELPRVASMKVDQAAVRAMFA